MNHYCFDLGEFSCIAVSDGSVNYPISSFAKDVPLIEIEHALSQRGLPITHIFTPYTCLYVDTGLNKVLIDTGLGPSLAKSVPEWFPDVDNSSSVAGTLGENLRSAGVMPEEIDTVIVTHAHPDHIGGNLDINGKVVFPNAQFYIWKDEWDFWSSDEKTTHIAQSFVDTARRYMEPFVDKLSFIEDESEIVFGVSAVPTHGHTPGHISVSIKSGDLELLHFSDAVLHPLHLEHIDWVLVFDILPEQSLESRYMICDRVAKNNALVFAHHFPPFPNLGHISKEEDRWRWKPLNVSG